VLESARDAGATSAFSIPLRLPWEVAPLFKQWLEQHFPERAARVMARVHEMRGGRDNDPRFGSRMQGQGVWGELVRQRLHAAIRRLGLDNEKRQLDLSAFRRPSPQAELF
jgi:DNA repair photolyase